MRKSFGFAKVALLVAISGAALQLSGCASKKHIHADYANHGHSDLDGRIGALEARLKTRASRVVEAPAGYKSATMAIPTGSEDTSALLIQKLVPTTVNAGAPYDYELVVTNLTDNLVLSDVAVEDKVPASFAFQSATPAPSQEGSTLRWTLPTLAPGAQQRIKVTGSASEPGTVEICSTARYTPIVCIDTLVERPALEITLDGPASLRTCDVITYTGSVKNSGTGVAKNVTVKKNVDSGLSVLEAGDIVIGDLGAGEAKTFSFQARASAAGDYKSVAALTSDNVASLQSGTVSTSTCTPAIAVDVAGPEKIFLGRQITYTVKASNPGSCSTDNSTVEALIPACVTFVSATDGGVFANGKVSWSLGNLAPGAERNLSVVVDTRELCNVQIDAAAAGDCAERATDNTQTAVVGIPAILLEVIDTVDPIAVGETTEYVLKITNQGTADGTNVRIEGLVEDMTILEATGATNGTIEGAKVTFAPVPVLPVKGVAEFRLKVRAEAEGDKRFKVSMTSDQFERPVEETESTNLYK